MAGPLYKLFLAKKTAAWDELSPDEQTALIARVNAALERVGAKRLVLGYCDPSATPEHWTFFGVEEFPTREALHEHSAILSELNWPRYSEGMAVEGSPSEEA